MQAWKAAMQLLQVHVQGQDLDSSPEYLATAINASLDQVRKAQPSRAVLEQMLQAEVRFWKHGIIQHTVVN